MAKAPSSTSDDIIKVTVSKVSERDQVVSLEEGATVADAVTAAGYGTDVAVKCNGENVGMDYIVEDEDNLFIDRNVKNN